MDTNTTILFAVLALFVVGALLAPLFIRRQRSKGFSNQFGPEYDRTVESLGSNTKAQKEMAERQKHVDTLDIRLLSTAERDRYLAEWTAVQAEFVNQPGQATVEADRLIMEVMQLRNYPLSDFDERAADISVSYPPELVSNYRAAREIAIKNQNHEADTEELRQAMIYYRSLFGQLLEVELVTA